MEKMYVCKPEGVFPKQFDFEELRRSHSWMVAHEFQGELVFENFSRAVLCWYEHRDHKYIGWEPSKEPKFIKS